MTYSIYLEQAKLKVKDNVLEEALELFQQALSVNPLGKEALYERGVLYTNLKKLDLALFDFNKLIELEDNNPFYYACRAFIKSGMRDGQGAILDYQTTLKLDPDDAITLNNLGLLQEQYNYKSDAEKSFERSNEILGYNPNRHDRTIEPRKEESANVNESKASVVKSVFTKKSAFREFISFIKNGFKIDRNDKS